jgi:hypothetical protein
MTTSDIRPNPAGPPALGAAMTRVVTAVAVLVVLEAAWFTCRFIVPRYEAHLMDAGFRPSPTLHGWLIASSYVARYFWWIAPILAAFFLFSPNPRSRGAGGQG